MATLSESNWDHIPSLEDLFRGNIATPPRARHEHGFITDNYMIQSDAATLLSFENAVATQQEEGSMTTRSEVIAARMAQLEKELAGLKIIEEAGLTTDGTIVKYVRRLGSGDEMQDFTYVAVRAAGRWFTTAQRPGDANLTEEAFFGVLASERTIFAEILKVDKKIK